MSELTYCSWVDISRYCNITSRTNISQCVLMTPAVLLDENLYLNNHITVNHVSGVDYRVYCKINVRC